MDVTLPRPGLELRLGPGEVGGGRPGVGTSEVVGCNIGVEETGGFDVGIEIGVEDGGGDGRNVDRTCAVRTRIRSLSSSSSGVNHSSCRVILELESRGILYKNSSKSNSFQKEGISSSSVREVTVLNESSKTT